MKQQRWLLGGALLISTALSGRGIDFGSKTSALRINSGGTLHIDTNLTCSGGTIKLVAAGAAIEGNYGNKLYISDGKFENNAQSLLLDGYVTLSPDTTIVPTYDFTGTGSVSVVTFTLNKDYYLNAHQIMHFSNSYDMSTIYVDGNGHTIYCNPGDANIIVIDGVYTQVDFQNVTFKGLDSGTANDYGRVLFDQGSQIVLDRDLTLTASWQFWAPESNPAQIVGSGNVLDLTNGFIRVYSGLLSICDTNLYNVGLNQLEGNSVTTTVQLVNSTVWMNNDWSIGNGTLQISGYVPLNGPCTLNHVNCLISIESNSIFNLSDVTNFMTQNVNPNAIFFTDATSVLGINGGTFHCTTTPQTLSGGTLRVRGYNSLVSDAGVLSEALTFGTSSILNLDAGSTLDVTSGQLYLQSLNNHTVGCASQDSMLKASGSGIINIYDYVSSFSGTLKVQDSGAIVSPTGNDAYIIFTDGIIDLGDRVRLSGVYSISSTCNALNLSGSQIVRAKPSVFFDSVNLSGSENRIEGQLRVNQDIYCADANTTVTFALSGMLNNNIHLAGGAVRLEDDLSFADGKMVCDGGTVDVNNYRISFGSNGASPLTFSTNINWKNAGDISLNGDTALSGLWYFDSDATINGNGNVLDLTLGGTLAVGSGVTLSLTNIYLKGLGTDGAGTYFGKIVHYDGSSQVCMSNVGVELATDVTTSIGGIYVEGPTNWFVGNHNWIFDAAGSLTIDGTTLWIDQGSQLTTTAGQIIYDTAQPEINFITYLNSGTYKSLNSVFTDSLLVNSLAVVGDIVFSTSGDQPITVVTLNRDYALSQDQRMVFSHDTYTTTVVLNGNGHTISFAQGALNCLVTYPNVSLSFQNIVLNGLDNDSINSAFQPGNENSNAVYFDSNASIYLSHDITLTHAWVVQGMTGDITSNPAQFYGSGNTLTFGDGGQIYTTNGSLAEFHNLQFDNVSGNNLYFADTGSHMKLINSTIRVAQDFVWAHGSMTIAGDVRFTGSSVVSYLSPNQCTINSRSRLMFDKTLTFSYAPQTALRNGFIFTDSSSILYLNGCTLHSTTTGMQLTIGTLRIANQVKVVSDATVLGEAIILGNGIDGYDLIIDFEAGGMLDITSGYVDYANTEQ